MFELADFAIADHLTGEPEDARGALLGAELKDAFVAMDFFAQCPVFGQIQPHWFLHVNVLAGADGRQRGQDVPVIGCRDEESVDVFPGDNLAEVAISGAIVVLIALVDRRASLFELVLFHIAHSHNLGVRLVQKVAHVPPPLRPDANAADDDAVAGRHLALFAQRGSGDDRRKRSGRNCQAGGLHQELPSCRVVGFHIELVIVLSRS